MQNNIEKIAIIIKLKDLSRNYDTSKMYNDKNLSNMSIKNLSRLLEDVKMFLSFKHPELKEPFYVEGVDMPEKPRVYFPKETINHDEVLDEMDRQNMMSLNIDEDI